MYFFRSAHPLIVLYICENFYENTWNDFYLTKQTQVHGRNGYVPCSKGNNSKSKQTKVMVCEFLFVCIEVLRPSQPNGVMSSAVSLPNHTFTGQL